MIPSNSWSPHLWPYGVAVLAAMLLAAYTWSRRPVRGGVPFIAGSLLLSILFLIQLLIVTANILALKIVFHQAWMVFAAWSSLVGLWLAFDYAGLMAWVSRRTWVLLSLPLLIFSALIATNAAHGLVWSRLWDDGGVRSTLGFAGTLGVAYAYALAAISLIVLLRLWGWVHGALRWQVAMLILGGLVISTGLSLETSRLPGAVDAGLPSVLCTIGLLISAIAILRSRASESLPVTRHTLVERMSYGMMVLDGEYRVVDLNPAAQRLLAAEGRKALGQDVRELLAAWPELLQTATGGGATHTEVAINNGPRERVFDAYVSPLLDLAGRCTGRLVLWIDVTENKATQAASERQRSALAALAEREQVGRELHDGLVQVLGYIKMQAQSSSDALERGRPDTANAGLRNIAAIAQEAHEEIQDFLLGARAASRISSGLWNAVTDFAERYSVVHGLRIDLSLSQQANDITLDPVMQVQLLRIIQESLTNVRKHAGVSRVDLAISRDNYCLQVTVRDDGKGFDPYTAPGIDDGHYGLAFMRQRAEEVGGQLDVISAPGEGTTVLVQVPVSRGDGGYATAPRG